MDTLQSTYGDSEASEPTPPPPPEDAAVASEPPTRPSSSSPEPETEPPLEEKQTPPSDQPTPTEAPKHAPPSSKRKKKSKDVWSTTSRKKPKKAKTPSNGGHANAQNTPEAAANPNNQVLLTPIAKFPDKHDDSPELPVLLSKSNKAEKVELSEDRLTASSSKGYRMVRATRGVSDGAWYFEVRIVRLGESGHTRLGWSTDRGDLQAPVGYDVHGYGYRDVDGSKVHKALREGYGDSYGEGDVIGFYINLPDGDKYAPEMLRLVWYKGQRYLCGGGNVGGAKEEAKIVPGSGISFFKNGISQGVAFADLCGGRYYPAASMYTLPNQPSCVVKFNFGPHFDKFPEDFGDVPTPKPMSEAPYQGYEATPKATTADNGGGVLDEKTPNL